MDLGCVGKGMLGISFLDGYNVLCSMDRKILEGTWKLPKQLALFGTAKRSFVFESNNMNF